MFAGLLQFPFTTLKKEPLSALAAEDVMFVRFARRPCDSGGERKSSHPGGGEEQGKKSRVLVQYLTRRPPSLPRFKICDLCAPCGELTHTNTSLSSPSHSLPSARVKGTNCELGIGKSIRQK